MYKLTTKDFASMLREDESFFSKASFSGIEKAGFEYDKVTGNDRDQIILDILNRIDSPDLKVCGPHRRDEWDEGWAENLRDFSATADIDELAPRYFRVSQTLRIKRSYVLPQTPNFLRTFHALFCRIIFERYFSEMSAIWEFGCGTGHNLLLAAEVMPGKPLTGLDWAASSVALVENLREYGNISGRLFDMFSPDFGLPVPENSAFLTVHAMEQLGKGYGPFLDFILIKKPSRCVHIEPVVELYEETNLLDYLAAKYHRRRGYLEDFLPALYRLQENGKIEIEKVARSFVGSVYDEGYSLIVWRPL